MLRFFFVFFVIINNVNADNFAKIENYEKEKALSQINVMISKNTYLVSNVVVSGVANTDNDAFENGLYNAKIMAFKALKRKIEDDVLSEDPEIIDSAMVGFVPNDGSYKDGIYYSRFEILFDRDKIASLITDTKMTGQQKERSGSESVIAKIAIKNDLKNWIKMKNKLNDSQIPYEIVTLNINEVEVLFKDVKVQKLTEDLKRNGLDLVQNRSFYYIKTPPFM